MNIKTQNQYHLLDAGDPFQEMNVGSKHLLDLETLAAAEHLLGLLEDEEGELMPVIDGLRFVSDFAKQNAVSETDAYIVRPQLFNTFKYQQNAFDTVDRLFKRLTRLKECNKKRSIQNG